MPQDTFMAVVDGVETEFQVLPITATHQKDGQKIYNQAFSDALKSGSMVRARLDDLLTAQGLWDDNKQQLYMTTQKKLADLERSLSKGGISLKQAKAIAIDMKKRRLELRDLVAVKSNLDSHTAEGQADNARFNYMVSACVVYKKSQKRYFETYDDYLSKSSDNVAILGSQNLAFSLYGLDSDYEKKLAENKFLLKYKLVNDKLEYVDDKGRTIDEEGRLIDAKDRFINEEGQYVDANGNVVDKEGDYVVAFEPFTDDNGNPIEIKEDETKPTPEDKQSPEVEQPQTTA